MLLGRKVIGSIMYPGGIPATYEEFTWAWGQMIHYNCYYLCDPGEEIFYWRPKASYHSYARNCMFDKMVGDWLLMLDTDHEFEPDIAARMVTAMFIHKVDVLVGIYHYKSWPHSPVVLTREGKHIQHLGDWDRKSQLFQIGSSGAGCLLVRRKVFERIIDELDENPFEIRKCYSEDNSFFDRCWDLGIKCYCAPQICSPHLAVKRITTDDYHPEELGDRIRNPIQVEGRVIGVK